MTEKTVAMIGEAAGKVPKSFACRNSLPARTFVPSKRSSGMTSRESARRANHKAHVQRRQEARRRAGGAAL